MDNKDILPKAEQLKHLKWVEIISQESQATKLDSMYIIEKDKVWCEVLFIDKNGEKRKVGGSSYEQIKEKFALLDLSNLTEEAKSNWSEILGGLSTYDIAVKNGFRGNEAEWLETQKGPKGDVGEISVITFKVDKNMHLHMQLETNSSLNFQIDENGHLILNN